MVRQALGKGLDALIKQTQQVVNMPTNEAAVQVQQTPGMSVTRIDVNKIVPNRFQPRRVFNEEKLQELAQSIKEHGLTQPIVVVYDAGLDKYEIVVGERRFRATQLAGSVTINKARPCPSEIAPSCKACWISGSKSSKRNALEIAALDLPQ